LDIYPYLTLAKDTCPCNDKIKTGIILKTGTVPPSKIKKYCRQLHEE
jgi:hypothetical protein